MIDFTTRTFIKNDTVLIQNGQPIQPYTLPDRKITFFEIEQLYADYETSFPNQYQPCIFKAKTESELTLHDIVYHKNRSDAQELLEQTLLEGILNQSLIYPAPSQWFFQSPINKNLILPRWIFTQECTRRITYPQQHTTENELWDRNLVGRRLRKTLNKSQCQTQETLSVKQCFLIIKEELTENETCHFFTKNLITALLHDYMKMIHNHKRKSVIGQYVSAIKNAKTDFQRIKAIHVFLENCPQLDKLCALNIYEQAYQNFVDYRTLLFIKTFIPNTPEPSFLEPLKDYTEQYILDNKIIIQQYLETSK